MPSAANARARVRVQLTGEIVEAARGELAASGSSGLSLRAVARRLDMAPSAVYRYFDSRDALLTVLIIEAYGALSAAAVAADAAAGPAPLSRWLAVGRAVRAWAWQHPQEWELIYGSPVPGYRAPQDTVDPAMGLVRVLAGILLAVHGTRADPVRLPVVPPLSAELTGWMATVREPYLAGLPDPVVALAVVAYTNLLGAVSSELFGQFGPDATPAPAIFDYGLLAGAALLGLSPPRPAA